MVAALAYSFAKNEKPELALKFAVACGAGTAKQPSTQLFDTEELEFLSKQISVITLNI